MTRSKLLEHMRDLSRNVVDERASEPVRAGHARMLAEHVADTREALEVVAGVLSGSEVLDVAWQGMRGADQEVVRAAAQRIEQRRQLEQLRANELPVGKSVVVLDPRDTGRQDTYPLLRQLAVEVAAPGPRIPVVPGVVEGDAVVNTEPLDDDTQLTIADVGGNTRWDWSAGYVNLSRQVLDYIEAAGSAMLDQALFDAVDQAAEERVVSLIEAAAGDTRVAATLADDLDGAEGVAGAAGNGAAWLVLAHPLDWPAVRRALPAAWGDGPRPLPVISSGATPGTVTYAGRGAFALLAAPRLTLSADEPKVFGKGVVVMRQFKLIVRNADAIATVTGVGA